MLIENIVKIVLAPTSRALEAKCLWSRTENILGCKNHQGGTRCYWGKHKENTQGTHRSTYSVPICLSWCSLLVFSNIPKIHTCTNWRFFWPHAAADQTTITLSLYIVPHMHTHIVTWHRWPKQQAEEYPLFLDNLEKTLEKVSVSPEKKPKQNSSAPHNLETLRWASLSQRVFLSQLMDGSGRDDV